MLRISEPYFFAGKVSVALHHLELMAVNKKASFQIHVETSDNAELAVSVTGPRWEGWTHWTRTH